MIWGDADQGKIQGNKKYQEQKRDIQPMQQTLKR